MTTEAERIELKEEWLALEGTPEWARPVIEQAAERGVFPLVTWRPS